MSNLPKIQLIIDLDRAFCFNMLRNKAFNKKTSRGKVVKVVKEHYLREDIYCSIPGCSKCPLEQKLQLPDLRIEKSIAPELVNLPHYIIPDTNVVLNQVDFLEHLTGVIILSTVAEEVRNLSDNVYKRVKTWFNEDLNKKFLLFSNEHHKDTYVERIPNESPNDRNDRAIRVATKWFSEHLTEIGAITVVMLSDDADNRKKAQNDNLFCFSAYEYAKNLKDSPELVDLISEKVSFKEKEEMNYPEYVSNTAIKAGIKSGKYIQGTLAISSHNYLEGSIFAKVDGEERAINIVGRQDLNRSVHGDNVCVELLPKDQWGGLEEVVITNEEDEAQLSLDDSSSNSKAKASIKQESESRDRPIIPRGKVVGILKRNWRPYCGFIDRSTVRSLGSSTTGQNQYVLFLPLDNRIPKIRIRTRQAGQLLSQRIVVAIDAWPLDSRYPSGHFVKALGEAGDKATETEVLLLEHDVPHHEFPPQVLNCLPSEGDQWVVRDEHLTNRTDFRGLDICSIDPPGCTDIDDALHARQLEDGSYEVGVHIADVTHFVTPNTAMDREAANRCTTVYLVNQRIDMLPSLLGTNLCSLRSNVDRLAFSCIWRMDENAQILDTKFTKSIIRSKHSFTYEEAQKRIDDASNVDTLTQGIRTLNNFAKILKARRLAAGALTLSSPEVRFSLEHDSQDPVDVEMKALHDTNALVEEFMLLANISVAQHIYKTFPRCALLRSHPTPPPANFEILNAALSRLGVKLSFGSSKELADSLDAIDIPEDPYLNQLVRILTTRCMMQARYFSSGSVPYEDFKHYGLAAEIYTHFTSPIRRYSDVIVHRLLHASINEEVGLDSSFMNPAAMEEQCKTLNHRHKMAQNAARASVELFTHLFFQDRVLYEMGYVIRILKNGFVVLVPKYGLESIVHLNSSSSSDTESEGTAQTSVLSKIKLDYTYDEAQNQLTFPTSLEPVHIHMFLKVQVELKLDKHTIGGGEGGLKQRLKVSLVEPKIEGLSVERKETVKDDNFSPKASRVRLVQGEGDNENEEIEMGAKLRRLEV